MAGIDIRNARTSKKFNDTGTVPQEHIAPTKESKPIPDVDENGEVTIPMAANYDGDYVIAGYMEFLQKNGVTEEDVQNVLDALLTSGNVSWSFDLFERIPVTFVTREAWLDDYITEQIDDIASRSARVSNVRFNNLVAECNLAASLAQFRDEHYRIEKREDLEVARTRVQHMPHVIQNALVRKLAVFDRTLAVATSDWAVRNFTKPRQESSEPGQSSTAASSTTGGA